MIRLSHLQTSDPSVSLSPFTGLIALGKLLFFFLPTLKYNFFTFKAQISVNHRKKKCGLVPLAMLGKADLTISQHTTVRYDIRLYIHKHWRRSLGRINLRN